MKKKPVIIVCLAITICWLILNIGVFIIAKAADDQIFLANFSGHHVSLSDLFFVSGMLAAGWALYGLIRAWQRVVRLSAKVGVILGYIAVAVVVFVLAVGTLGHRAVTTCHEFASPDGAYRLTLAESSFLLMSHVEVYERTSTLFIKDMAYLVVDDGATPISNGHYTLDWDGNTAVIAVDANTGGVWSAARITFNGKESTAEPYQFYPNGVPLSSSDSSDITESSEPQDMEPEVIDPIIQMAEEGIIKVANSIDTSANNEISYSSKGTPQIILYSDDSVTRYIRFDRESKNGNCALYVLYEDSSASNFHSSTTKIIEMYAYEYSTGTVIVAGKQNWSDLGTEEYRNITGE